MNFITGSELSLKYSCNKENCDVNKELNNASGKINSVWIRQMSRITFLKDRKKESQN